VDALAALVGVGPADSGPEAVGSTLDDTPLTSCCSFSSIRTFAWLGSGSAMTVVCFFTACASECGELGV